jgi:hypothetical protein
VAEIETAPGENYTASIPPRGQTPGWGGVVWLSCSKCREFTDLWLEQAARMKKPFICRKCTDKAEQQQGKASTRKRRT